MGCVSVRVPGCVGRALSFGVFPLCPSPQHYSPSATYLKFYLWKLPYDAVLASDVDVEFRVDPYPVLRDFLTEEGTFVASQEYMGRVGYRGTWTYERF